VVRKGGRIMIARRSSVVKMAMFAVALVAVLSSDAAATHSNGTGPKMDFVFGTGIFRAVDLHEEIHVNARSGAEPLGEFFARLVTSPALDFDFRGQVTCLTVNTHDAVFGGEITQSRLPNIPVGWGILIQVHDDGEPGTNDKVLILALGPATDACPTRDAIIPLIAPNIDQGNFVVHEAACPSPCID